MNDELEIIKVETTNVDTYEQQERAGLDMQISTAKAFPRNLKRSMENAIAIVTVDRETASTCTYSVPRGGKAITGPSVHLAKILAQTYGNMRVEAKVISTDAKCVTSQAIAMDLENNVAIKVEVKRAIVGKYGRFNEDMIVVTGQAANSIALRNAILTVIPRSVVDKVYKEAMQTITGDISDKTKFLKRRKQVFDGLKDTYELTEKEILGAVGKAAVDHITGDDLVVLIGIGQAIKDGDTSVDMAFRPQKAAKEDVKAKNEALLKDEAKEPAKTPELTPEQKAAIEADEAKAAKENKLPLK